MKKKHRRAATTDLHANKHSALDVSGLSRKRQLFIRTTSKVCSNSFTNGKKLFA